MYYDPNNNNDGLHSRYAQESEPDPIFELESEPEPEPEPVPQPQPEPQPKAAPRPKSAPNRAKQPAPSAPKTAGLVERAVADGHTRQFAGIVLLIAVAYTLIAMLSSLFAPGADQALVDHETMTGMVERGVKMKNICGPLGATLGEFLLTGSLGIGSFVLLFWVAAIGLRWLGQVKFNFWSFTLKVLVAATSLSIILGLITYDSSFAIRIGGHHGRFINQALMDYTSIIGAVSVSLLLLILLGYIFGSQVVRLVAIIRLLRSKLSHPTSRNVEVAKAPTPKHPPVAPNPEPKPKSQPEPQPEPEFEPEIAPEPQPVPALAPTLSPSPSPSPSPSLSLLSPPEGELAIEIEAGEIEEAASISSEGYDPTAELSHFHFPSIDLLEDRQSSRVTVDSSEVESNKQRIVEALAQFNIQISSIKATVGPTITLFEVVPAPGQRIASIKRVEEDMALALKALGIRIIAPIPGKGTIGIEVPNNDPQVVSMRSIIASKKFQECRYELPMALGATISNDVFIADLAKMPHLLVAGATGQGKSVGLNAIITSLLYKKHPAELKFVLIDPKMVEFSLYRVLEKHYLAKLPDEESAVITDPNKVVATLNSLCVLMDQRYELLSKAGCRGLKEYNAKFIQRRLNPEKGHVYMPYIVVIVDEFADLIMTAGKEVEAPICRLAQKARAVGIHVIIATQRPSTNVITGLIKANFPGRIAFRVAQMVDSKTILDRSGAHQLVGKGDMFFSTNGNLERVQCAFVDTPEVEAICEEIASQQGYPMAYELPDFQPDPSGDFGSGGGYGDSSDGGGRDPLFEEAARFLVSAGNTASTSVLQRRYSIGYNRAGKIMDQLEKAGIVGPVNGSKPRPILVDPFQLDTILS